MKRLRLLVVAMGLLLFAAELTILRLVEPEITWGRTLLWKILLLANQEPSITATNPASAWFQAVSALNNLVLVAVVFTIIIPPVFRAWNARSTGEMKIRWWDRWGKRLYLIVGAVDWEKVFSLVEEHRRMFPDSHIVVVADHLPDMPPALRGANVSYVRGSLRDRETYDRAYLAGASGVYVCAVPHLEGGQLVAYNTSSTDVWTAAIMQVVRNLRPNVAIIGEQINRENDDLFAGYGIVSFDTVVLRAVAARVAELVGAEPANVVAKTIDEAQEREWRRQLEDVGVKLADSGVQVRVVLPSSLDDPSADCNVWAAARRVQDSRRHVVALYLSVRSSTLLTGENAVCADRVVAEALVATMAAS